MHTASKQLAADHALFQHSCTKGDEIAEFLTKHLSLDWQAGGRSVQGHAEIPKYPIAAMKVSCHFM